MSHGRILDGLLSRSIQYFYGRDDEYLGSKVLHSWVSGFVYILRFFDCGHGVEESYGQTINSDHVSVKGRRLFFPGVSRNRKDPGVKPPVLGPSPPRL